MGHYSDFCPNPVEGDQHHIDAFEMLMSEYGYDKDDEEEGATTTDEAEEDNEDVHVKEK